VKIVEFLKTKLAGVSSERGVALLIVLWIFIFLFVVAFDFSSGVREEATAAHRYSDDNQGYYLALAGFEQGLYDFLGQSRGPELQPVGKPKDIFDAGWREATLGSGTYRLRLVDESSKINLNRADENVLRRIFSNLGVEEPLIGVLIDSIMDWRDQDDLHRSNGAEDDYYLSLSLPYTAKNGSFDSLEELLWVKGVTASLYYGYDSSGTPAGDSPRVGLREIFSVDSPIDRVNLRTASPAVIHVLLGIPLEKCQAFVEERAKIGDKTLADLLPLLGVGSGDAALQMFIFANPTIVTVEAEGYASESRQPRRVKGVIRAGGGNRGYELTRWVDREIGYPSERQ
jgi:general secretion pathway protein K